MLKPYLKKIEKKIGGEMNEEELANIVFHVYEKIKKVNGFSRTYVSKWLSPEKLKMID
jgi:hypothetical protein